jgi:signal transduction histidine kinase
VLLQWPVTYGFWVLATIGGLIWTAMTRRTRLGVAGALTLGVVAVVAAAVTDPVNMGIMVQIVLVAVAGGCIVGRSRTRADSARSQADRTAAEHDAAAATAVHSERVTMARDLHDVVSHALGVIVLQAGAAEAQYPHAPARARSALRVVRQAATDGLTDLTALLEAVRTGALGAPLLATGAIERGTDDLHALLRRMRAAGLDIRLDLTGELQGQPGTAAYRIVQEALTNALRHAPASRVMVTVRVRQSEVTVEVVDNGPGAQGGAGRGYGLIGIAERVDSLGGDLHTGPDMDGSGFRVSARLPRTAQVPR